MGRVERDLRRMRVDKTKSKPRPTAVAAEVSFPSQALAIREAAPGIFSIKLMDTDYCAAAVQGLRNIDSWNAARVSAPQRDSKSAVRQQFRSASILGAKGRNQLYFDFERKVRTIIQPLILKFWEFEVYGCDGTQLVRYRTGDRYVPHKDSCEDPSDRACSSRYFTVLCYLNDDFEGGRTSFPGLEYTAVPAPGRALIFPSNYLHAAMPVVAGEKFVIVTWLYGPALVRWI
jgi:predicted 2-oxoglutarate/Fe(II)-dependent dioxygenase YbiX